MKRRWLALSTSLVLGLAAVGCGESTSSAGPSAGSGGQAASAGSAATGGSHASGGSASGTSHAGAGSPSAGSSSASGGSPGSGSGGSSASGTAGAHEPDEGGAGSGGAAGDLAVCDPKRVLCKLLPGDCPEMQVRAVEGTCWGECVDIAQCACSVADDCPDNDRYTCWMKSHCGPYVR